MHSSAEKIRKPKTRPVPRMKKGAPKKQAEPVEPMPYHHHRMRDNRRIIPGHPGYRSAPDFIESNDKKLSGVRGNTRHWWADEKVKVLSGKLSMLQRARRDGHVAWRRPIFSSFPGKGVGGRRFRKFKRHHPLEALRLEIEDRRRQSFLAAAKTDGVTAALPILFQP